ncbi:phosphate ABC transporter substrate-binding protein PstS [Propionibacteriaceae bacterium G57]|uniref:phosphate ABC transporter substrate-binding protein PstS n=1 Tax=Aestuariimicrobium sp. G57 TaxID=3418485 RepID=UPI003DA73364
MNRFAKIAAVVAVGALTFTACGGDTTGTTTTSAATTGGAGASSSAPASSGAALELACPAGKVNGGGSSAQDIAMQALTQAYNTACGGAGQVVYTKSGSGAGIKDFYNKQLQWAGSDSALKSKAGKDGVVETEKVKERCAGNAGWNLPLIVGPVAFAYNLPGVNDLVLTPSVMMDIFNGKVTSWDAAEIKALNPSATLPAKKINVFFRDDESGTTENVSKYLKAAAPDKFTKETSKKYFGTAGEGKQGTQGVADAVKATEGGFGYMEWKYATDAKLGVSSIDNGDGAVKLTAASAGAAMDKAEVKGEGNDLVVSLKYTGLGKDVYPMVMVTYEIVCSAGLPAAEGALMKDFLTYASSEQAQATLEAQGYAPLPAAMLTKVQTAVKAMK